ncbi:MAG: glycosyltransferase [Clostridia bacterium]|nr:glycosyltransferase [Clostridia bacterium]
MLPKKTREIAVLLPCYNEEQTVEKVIRDFLAALPTATIYVYNNNSTDRTEEIARSVDDARVVVRREYRQGKGSVVRSMFRDIDADCYLMADADDTYPAEHAPEMVAAVLDVGFDMVIGDRLSTPYYTENKRRFHNVGNRLVKRLVNRLFGGSVKDIMTGYRAFSYDFVKSVPILSDGFEVETEMTIHALDKRLHLKEIPIRYRDRPAGSVSKLHTVRDGLRVLGTVFFMFRDYRPQRFFGAFSALFGLAGVGFFLPVLIEYFRTGLVPRIPTLIVSVLFFLAALLSFAVGSILEVIIKKDRQAAMVDVANRKRP